MKYCLAKDWNRFRVKYSLTSSIQTTGIRSDYDSLLEIEKWPTLLTISFLAAETDSTFQVSQQDRGLSGCPERRTSQRSNFRDIIRAINHSNYPLELIAD